MSSTAQGQVTENAKELVQVLIRIWHARSDAHFGRNEDAHARAQVLADDVLSSMLAATTDHARKGYVWAWGINDLTRALATSLALQEAFNGFRGTAPAVKTTISVVLDRSPAWELETPKSSRPSLELTSLLDVASPGQVLVTQSFYKSVDACQPLQLRSFPLRAGVYEWLWTSGERLDLLRSDPDFGPMLVEDPRSAGTPTVATGPSQAASTVPLQAPETEIREAPPDEVPRDGFRLGNLRSYKVAVAAVLAMALVAGAGWWLSRTHPVGPVPVPSPAPTSFETEIVSLSPEAAEIPLAGKVQVFVPKGHAWNPPPRQGCSSDEIQYFLRLAEENRDREQYDASIGEYNHVLSCDPGNYAARQGLAKTQGEKKANPEP